MSDPISTGAAVLGTGLSFFQAFKERAKATGNVEFVAMVSDAHDMFLSLREENAQLRDRIRELERVAEHARELGEMVPTNNGYWRRKPDGTWDGPFCIRCADVEKKLVRLPEAERHVGGRVEATCRECHRDYPPAAAPP